MTAETEIKPHQFVCKDQSPIYGERSFCRQCDRPEEDEVHKFIMTPELTPEQQAAEDARKMREYEAMQVKPIVSPVYQELFPNGMGRLNEEVHTIAQCICASAYETRKMTEELKAVRVLLEMQLNIIDRETSRNDEEPQSLYLALQSIAEEIRLYREQKKQQMGLSFQQLESLRDQMVTSFHDILNPSARPSPAPLGFAIPVPAYTDPDAPHPFIHHDPMSPRPHSNENCAWCDRPESDALHVNPETAA